MAFITVIKKIRNTCNTYVCGYLQAAKYTSLDGKSSSNVCASKQESPDFSSVVPYFPKTFNLAAYVNHSEALQNLLKLNVNLSKIEKKPQLVEKLLKLDFEINMKNHIVFLSNYVGMEEIGQFLTKNPMFLCEPLEDLHVRVNYLESKRFSYDQICRIINKNPFWLMFSSMRIDRRIGYFQHCLDLDGAEVRQIVSKQPNLITYNLHHIKTNLFVVKEEMGFKDNEIKELAKNRPKIFMLSQKSLLERFNYIHNIMKISHSTILTSPSALLVRNFKIKQRHNFLEKLGRAQYDPRKENYVPLLAIVAGTDEEFCIKTAKCTVDVFNMFLKTL